MDRDMADAVQETRDLITAMMTIDAQRFATADPLFRKAVVAVLAIQAPIPMPVGKDDLVDQAVAALVIDSWNTCMHEVLVTIGLALGVK